MANGSSFTKKILTASITLGQGTFGEDKGNTVVLTGLRMECEIEKGGHPSKNECRLRIYGMKDTEINQLTTLSFKPLAVRRNLLQITAGDESGMSTVFQGEITSAWANYHSPPNLYFEVRSMAGYYPAIKPVAPKGYKGATPVAAIMQSLASQMGYAFENNGVTGSLDSPYLPGSAYQQASYVAAAANIEFGIDDGTLFIAPRGTPRGMVAALLSAETGMKEFPVFDKHGIRVETLWNPSVALGGLIRVKSLVNVANGTWRVNGLRTHLSAQVPNGKWFSTIKASYVGS